MSVYETFLEITDVFEKLKPSEIPQLLVPIRLELISNKEGVILALEQFQELCNNRNSIRRYRARQKPRSKEQDKSFNDSYKCLKTCADEDVAQNYDSSLYHMILCQAAVL